jgi:hypothetical protein
VVGLIGSSSYAAACDRAAASAPGYASRDSHGRVTDLHYTTSAGATIHRYQHGYDLMDNPLYARTTQGTHANDRSYLYGYDAFQRLTSAQLGTLNTTNTGIETDTTPRSTTWNLHIVGNWSGDAATGLSGGRWRGVRSSRWRNLYRLGLWG